MIARLWRGDIALWKTFWLFGAVGGLILGLPVFGAMLALTDVPDDATALQFVSALGFLLVYLIWVSVGIWRAAGNYRGDRAWAVGAKLAVAVLALNVVILAVSMLFAQTD